MERQFVNYTLEDGIAIVTIDHPPANALDTQTRMELADAFDELTTKKGEVRVVILRSAGDKFFVSGSDIKRFIDMTPESAMASVKQALAWVLKIEQFEAPVICAIKGYCLGGGLELAMCCDLRIAADDSKLGQPELNLSIIPGGGATQRLARLVGAGIAKDLIFTGRQITAQEGQSIGLITKVVPKDEVLEEAKKMAKLIAAKGPLAVRAAKKAINRGLDMPLLQGLELENDYFSGLFVFEDPREGAKAFLEKRPPEYKGK
jgi:enoyl-CoA hydratase